MEDVRRTDPTDPPPAAETSPDTATGVAPASLDAEALGRERDALYDRLLRKTAEFDNYRKRIERERRAQADQAVTDLLLDLLLVVDDFDRALTIEAGRSAEPYRKGVELIHGKLHALLATRAVRPIEVLGQDFDPNLHQAVTYEASPDHRDGEILGELRRGYLIGDRLLRAAMVKVAKA